MTKPVPPKHLPADVAAAWQEVVDAYGDDPNPILGPSLEAYCGQVAILRGAQRRIAEEGLIVADTKGHPIKHPAIAIERSAQDEIRKWGDKFKPRRDTGLGL